MNDAPLAPDVTAENRNPAKDGTDNRAVNLAHTFVAAATIPVDEKRARRAAKYQSFYAQEGERVDVLDVYCSGCRRNIEDLARGSECAAKVDNTHLIGGDQTHRARRKPLPDLPAGAVLIPGPRVRRFGIEAYINAEV